MAEATRFLIHFYWYIKKIVDYCWSSTNVMQAQLAILLGRFGYLYWILESRILDASLSMKNLRLIIRQIQFSVFPQRNPIGRICVLFSFRSVTILSVRAVRDSSPPPLPQNHKYTRKWFFSLSPLQPELLEDHVQARPHDQRRLLIRCQELYLKIRRSSVHLRSRRDFLREREWSAWKYLISPHDTEWHHAAETRVKEKTLFRLLSLSLHLFFDPYLHPTMPLRLDTREYIICIYNNTYYNNNLVVIFKLQLCFFALPLALSLSLPASPTPQI